MSPNPPPTANAAEPNAADPTAVPPSRPKLVDYAVYVLIARCVFAVLAAFAAYGDRAEITRQLADAYKKENWSAATLHSKVDAALKGGVISALVLSLLVVLLAVMIRQGKNYARYLYLVLSVIIAADLLQLRAFFVTHDNFLYAALTTLVGLCSAATLILLFLPASNAYFRRPGGASAGLFGSLIGSRANPSGPAPASRPSRATAANRGRAAGADVSLTKPAKAGAARPRGKSRQPPPRRPGAR